ncbi:patatin family protein [Ruminococcus sp.]|uniref:patatin-like phospholipase family protein n=1 Tax=Ruminococcus sp. TaxID=41978 RepID=UPI0025CC6C84|nr:patatin family protein [Ruminococcus sp.]MCR4639358.1 patatin family protein [Ruminococcus sp.]
MKKIKVYSGIETLPKGRASDNITEGCIVLEGGAFRGVYTSGVLDALMEEDINMRCTVGVSAGALNGVNYVSGQIGRSGRINLRYRHDSRYVGPKAIRRNKGIIGFDFVFGDMAKVPPLDKKCFMDNSRQFYAVVTDLKTGKTEYMEKNSGLPPLRAVRASASMPFVSKPVIINGRPYLDGGCSCKIPYQFAIDKGFDKIIVIKTRHGDFRKSVSDRKLRAENVVYRNYPEFARALINSNANYNRQCDELERLAAEGRIFLIAPSENIGVSRLDGDMEKLGHIYNMGYSDAKKELERLREYLK